MLLLAVMAMLLVASCAYSAARECRLLGDEATFESPELHEDNPDADESYFGYNYLAKYRLPKAKLYIFKPENADDEDSWTLIPDTAYTLSWDMVSEFNGLKLKEKTSDASGDIFVVSGYFPDSADAYTCRFLVTATVVDVNDETYREYAIGTTTSFDESIEISIGPDTEHISATPEDFARYVVYNSKDISLNEVTEDYAVTVTMSADYDNIDKRYGRYIRSDNDYTVNLPEWLKYEITGQQTSFSNEELKEAFEEVNGKAITSIVIKFNDNYDGKLLGELKEGTKARVNIPLVSADDFDNPEIVLSWDVEYHKKPDPFVITSSKTLTLTLEPGKTGSLTAEFSGSDPVRCDSRDVPAVKFIVGNTAIDPATGKGTINITAEARDTAEDGEYESVLTFTDAAGKSDSLTVKVTVKKPATPAGSLTLTGDPKTFSLKAGGTAKTTLTVEGNANGRITWTAGNVTPTADILVSCTAQGDSSAEISIVVGNNVAAGTYSSEIRATDSAGTSAGATLRITITADQKEQEQTDNSNDNTNQQTDNNQNDNTNNQNQNQDTNNQNQNTDNNNQTNTDSRNLTEKIKIRGESGSSAQSKPLSSLQAGSRAVYVISLEGTGVTAKAWKLLINGLTVDSAVFWAGGFTASASTSWAAITSSDATSATIEATPPKDLNIDSAVSVAVTGTDNQEYTADLGTVSKATTSQEEQTTTTRLYSSGGGCSGGFGMIVLAAMLAFRAGKRS